MTSARVSVGEKPDRREISRRAEWRAWLHARRQSKPAHAVNRGGRPARAARAMQMAVHDYAGALVRRARRRRSFSAA